jgi:hypothetical protein
LANVVGILDNDNTDDVGPGFSKVYIDSPKRVRYYLSEHGQFTANAGATNSCPLEVIYYGGWSRPGAFGRIYHKHRGCPAFTARAPSADID